jgi:hypothetical protein
LKWAELDLEKALMYNRTSMAGRSVKTGKAERETMYKEQLDRPRGFGTKKKQQYKYL